MRAKTSRNLSQRAQAVDDLLSWLLIVAVIFYRRRKARRGKQST